MTDDREVITYTVEILIPLDSDGVPTEQEIRNAIYQGVADVDTPDAVNVERQ